MAKGARQKKDRQGNHASSKGATLLKNYKGMLRYLMTTISYTFVYESILLT